MKYDSRTFWLVFAILILLSTAGLSSRRSCAQSNNADRTFQLNVIGPDGKPVADADLEIRSDPVVNGNQILKGTFVRKGRYSTAATTDEHGQLLLSLPDSLARFTVNIKEPGLGPFSARWETGSPPETFTAELEPVWSIGGIVVDSQGFPVEDAVVDPSIYYKQRPGDNRPYGVGTDIRTDPEGKWRYTEVPVSMTDVHVAIQHPKFQVRRLRLSRDDFELHAGGLPTGRIELSEGLVVTGKVTDPSGQPIEGTLVRTKFLNDVRQAKTDASGVYRLVGCEPRMSRIVVSAKGRAIDLREVRIDPEMKPVDFVMQPGGHLRIRVVDEQGKGIPKAVIFFQRWRGRIEYFEFDHISKYADENGVWEWNEAPPDEIQADIVRPGGMQLRKQPIVARQQEYVFSPPRALIVSGRVIDAQSKKPIKQFRVVPGLRNVDPEIGYDWIPQKSFDAKNGSYRIGFEHTGPAHVTRIEAEGYRVAISRDIAANEGDVTIDFELQPAEDIAAKIVSAEGNAAAGAKVALGVAREQIVIENGDIDDGSTYATRLDADSEGRFTIPSRDQPFQLVITHEFGFAHFDSAEATIPKQIQLTPWARAEGTFRVGPDPVPDVVLTLYSGGLGNWEATSPRIFVHTETTTGKGGRYIFNRVFPGKGRIGRRILVMVDDGAVEVTSSSRVSAEFIAGKTTNLDLGGSGRAVIGTLSPPASYTEPVLWSFAMIRVNADIQAPTAPAALLQFRGDPAGHAEWLATEEGQAWTLAFQSYEQMRDSYPYITASVDRDGSFRIDDVPPGNYVLTVNFDKQAPGRLPAFRFIAPPAGAGDPSEPLDLGVLTLE